MSILLIVPGLVVFSLILIIIERTVKVMQFIVDRCLKAFITVGNEDASDLSLVFVVSTFTLRNGKQYRQINAILKLIRCLRRMPMRNWLHM